MARPRKYLKNPYLLSEIPHKLPGRLLRLPQKCGVCGSHNVGYDQLNVIVCDNCGALLSISGRWHSRGLIMPLTPEDRKRARKLARA